MNLTGLPLMMEHVKPSPGIGLNIQRATFGKRASNISYAPKSDF